MFFYLAYYDIHKSIYLRYDIASYQFQYNFPFENSAISLSLRGSALYSVR